MFIKELSFPQTAPTVDAFFNRNWAGGHGGRWAGPELLTGRDVGLPLCRAVVGLLLLLIGRLLLMMLPCKNKQEEGSARASPAVASMPKSVSF